MKTSIPPGSRAEQKTSFNRLPGRDSPVLFLEIARGQTQFPNRPVIARASFLIGSGEMCDLRLGGDSVPEIHSMISSSGEDIRLAAIASVPALIVNGEELRTASLDDGDVIEIGAFRFVARKPEHPASSLSALAGNGEVNIDELSASQVIELIELEQSLIAQMEENVPSGIQALNQAIRQRMERIADEQTDARSAGAGSIEQILDERLQGRIGQRQQAETAELLKHLNDISQELEQRSHRLSERENHYARAAAQLLDSQQQLSGQLESLLEQVESLSTQRQMPARRIAG